MGKNGVGVALMVVAALFYGAMNISVKLSVSHLSVWQTAMGRFVLGILLLPPLVWLLRLDLFGRDRWLLAARGLSATAAFLLMILAFQTVPLSVAMVLFYLWPVFSCLLSAWVAGEPTTRREWPFVCGALAGTTLMLWPSPSGTQLSAGHFLALGAAFFAGLAIILVRRLGRNNNPFTLYFYFCLTGGIFCIGPFLTQGSPAIPLTTAGWIGLTAVAVFSMAGQVILNQGMKYLNASRTGVLMMIEVLAAAAFGVFFLGEHIGLRLLCGSALILGSGLALILLPARPAPP